MSLVQEIETGNFASRGWLLGPPSSIRVVSWNINRGLRLPSIIEFLTEAKADIVLLQEVDINARRTQRHNVAQEIARKLRLNYVFGREFIELTQGSKASPAYHGQATLSRWNIANPRVLHFQRQSNFWNPRWYLPKLDPFQERLGGRIALIADVDVEGVQFTSYNLHLESRASDELRVAQLKDVLRDAATYSSRLPIIIAGDLNLNASRGGAAEVLASAGFQGAVPTDRVPTTPPRHMLEPGHHIDWAFVRRPMKASKGRVHSSVKASDHYPISFDFVLSNGT
jgi:endonuclease/exonuclease/phosphatase family metal-dependent hydrolase